MFSILRAVFLAFGGLIVAGILSAQHLQPRAAERLCGGGCISVQTSKYAKVGAVPVAVIGAGFYTLALAGALACLSLPPGKPRRTLLIVGVIGVSIGAAASLGMMLVQFAVLKAFCAMCSMSAGICLLLAWSVWRAQRERETWKASPRRAAELAATFVGVGALAWLAMRDAGQSSVQVLAQVNGQLITTLEFDRESPGQYRRLTEDLYDLKREWLESKIDEALIAQEAKRRGIDVSELTQQEVDSKAAPVFDEIRAWVARQKKAEPNPPLPWWQVEMESIRQARRRQFEQFVTALRQRANIQVYLRSPKAALVYDRSLAQVRGREDMPIRLVVFTEFECPYPAELAGALNQVLDKYPLQISLTFVHMPMEFHPMSAPAAEAAECAAEQGRFWVYHDKLMGLHGEIEPKWEQYAREAGLDMDRFRQCLSSGKMKDRIERSRQSGLKMGIDGVPALYLNGRRIGGALTFDELCALIDMELKRMRER